MSYGTYYNYQLPPNWISNRNSTSNDSTSQYDYFLFIKNCQNASTECQPLNHDVNDTHYYCSLIVTVLSIIGMITIIITTITLRCRWMWNSTCVYLCFLGLIDFFTLLFLCVITIKNLTLHTLSNNEWNRTDVAAQPSSSMFHAFLDLMLADLMDMSVLASNLLTVVLGIERFVAICYPLTAKRMCQRKRAKFIACAAILAAILLTLPQFFFLKMKEVKVPNSGKTFYQNVDTDLFRNYTFRIVYSIIVFVIITFTFPLVSLLFINIRLILEVRRSTNFLRKCTSDREQTRKVINRGQRKITIMLIALMITHIICQGPYGLHLIVSSLSISPEGPYITRANAAVILIYIFMILMVLKSGFNFVLYCWFCDRFLATFKKILCVDCVFMLPNVRGKTQRSKRNRSSRSTNGSSSLSPRLLQHRLPPGQKGYTMTNTTFGVRSELVPRVTEADTSL